MNVATVFLGCFLVVCVTATIVVKDLVLGRPCQNVYSYSCAEGYLCAPVNYSDRARGVCQFECGSWADKKNCPNGYHCHYLAKGEFGHCHKNGDPEPTKPTRKSSTSTRPY